MLENCSHDTFAMDHLKNHLMKASKPEEASKDGVFTAAVRCQLINTLGGDKSRRLNVVSPSRPFRLNYAFQLHGGGGLEGPLA